MDNMKKRIDEIELRLQILEKEIQILRNEQKKEIPKDIILADEGLTNNAISQDKSKLEKGLNEKMEEVKFSDRILTEKSFIEEEIKSKQSLKKSEDNE